MKYKAIFFDRDGVLIDGNPRKREWLHSTVAQWSGKPFEEISYEKMMDLFRLASEGKSPGTGILTTSGNFSDGITGICWSGRASRKTWAPLRLLRIRSSSASGSAQPMPTRAVICRTVTGIRERMWSSAGHRLRAGSCICRDVSSHIPDRR